MAEAHSSPASPAPEEEHPPVVPPLTRGSLKRLPATKRQIAEALTLSLEELVKRAGATDEAAPGYLSPEALVFFIRREDRANDPRIRDQLIRALLERCNRFFRSQFRGFSAAVREDLQAEVTAAMIEHLLAADDRGDFMQRCFWTYLKRRCIDACRVEFKEGPELESLDTGYSAQGEAEGRTQLDMHVSAGLSPEDLTILSQSLAALPPPLRHVFIMRHYIGMKIGADNPADDPPGEVTIARHFGRPGRTIRNWLKQAEKQLTAFREK